MLNGDKGELQKIQHDLLLKANMPGIDDSGGAGKAQHEEGAAGAEVDTTTATAAGKIVSNQSSRGSDG